jgi:diguanylate cyclase (GGDEF)-like protein
MAKHARADDVSDIDISQLHDFLQRLGEAIGASLVQLVPTEPAGHVVSWAGPGVDGDRERETSSFARAWQPNGQAPVDQADLAGWQALVVPVARAGDEGFGTLVATRPADAGWAALERAAVESAAAMCGALVEAAGSIQLEHHRRLDELVTILATDLMPVSAAGLDEAYRHTLRTLTEFFGADTAFLRHNDHDRRISVLVAEWPERDNVPDPDPLAEVPFDGSDPTFARSFDFTEPYSIRPDRSSKEYQQWIQEGSGIPAVSTLVVPLLRGEITSGALGFVKFGDREWSAAEVNALRAIAALLAQLQARVEAEELLQVNAYHDDLTGLHNRRSFLEYVGRLLANRRARPAALLFVDLDRLKAINDFLGHGAADRFLRAMGARLQEAVPGQFVSRMGGDEFLIVVENVSEIEEGLRIGERLLEAASRPIMVGANPISRSASIGVAIGYPGETTVDELMLHADVALLEAKARGRNVVQPFNEEMRAKVQARSEIELHLANAISGGALRLHYQPEFDLRTGALLAVEGLVRWQHPLRGLLEAEEFIDIAEETNTIIELGRWALVESCRQLTTWRARHPDLTLQLRINVSPAQLISKDFVSVVSDTLRQFDVSPDLLCLEITERAVFPDLVQVLSTLRELRTVGVHAAIDGFGTGFSSLGQLKTLPVDTLIIDRRFVAGLGVDVGDTAIVEAIARLAGTFHLQLVAEGVESPRAVRELLRIGCDRAQGHLLGEPLPASLLIPVLAGERLDVQALLV